MNCITKTYKLPTGGTVTVTVRAELIDAEMPILNERNAVSMAQSLMGIADALKAKRSIQ